MTHSRNFSIRLKWNGRVVAGFSKVSALEDSTGVIAHREAGNDPLQSRLAGRTKYPAITLERGMADDREFCEWAGKFRNHGSDLDAKAASGSNRKDLSIEVCNEVGRPLRAYKLYRCWVSEYQAAPGRDTNVVAIEKLRLENEGWQADSAREQQEKDTSDTA